MSQFIKFYFTSSMLNMFRTLINPSSGACDFPVLSPHGLCVLVSMCVGVSVTQPHRNSNTHWTKNNTTNVVIQQNSRKLLMMDILMSETCWAHKKWNKIASDVKLVLYSSITFVLSIPSCFTVLIQHGSKQITWLVKIKITLTKMKRFLHFNKFEYF